MAAIAFLVFFSNAMFPPLIPTLAREFSVRPFDLKWLVPGFALIYGVATLAYGIVSDRLGRTPILKLLLCFAAIAMAVVSLARTADQLIVLRALSGLGTGGIVTIALSIIGDRYPYPVQGRPMGRLFGAIAAGMGLGVSLGPMLSAVLGWRVTLRLISIGFIVAGCWVHRCYRKHIARDRHGASIRWIVQEYRCILESSRGSRALTFIFANGLFHGGIFAWLGVLLAERYNLSAAGIGFVLIGYGIPDLILGRLIGGWADRFGRRYVVPAGFFWAAVCAGLLALHTTPWISGLAVAALSIGFDATHPLMSSITTSLDPKHRGQVTGMTTFANFLGMAIGALVFRELLRLGYPAALLTFAGLETLFGVAAAIGFMSEVPQT
ncbi:MFS transporter [Granulicella sp. S190]|uniref:MFS transporter n=1 Tax=Granulicella sp. S190 TaxID=1747226 RepID=UPI00131D5C9D|nr:MFS transporter [Granulicella sp. S190]